MRLKTFSICFAIVLSCLGFSAEAQQSQTHSLQTPLHLDHSPYPIDNRKPCHVCSRPNDFKAIPHFDLPGLRGRPHIDKGIGGCTCGKKCNDHHPMKNWNWSQPFSALRECRNPGLAAWLDDPCRKRLTDAYDQIGDFRLLNYQRSDNGHCGPGRDPFGCLGESRPLQSNVMGLQFRQPGEPVFGSTANPPNPIRQIQPTEPRVSHSSGYDLEAYRKR